MPPEVQPMHIGVDFDEVVTPFWVPNNAHYNLRHGTNHDPNDLVEYEFSPIWGIPKVECIAEIDAYILSVDHANQAPIENAFEVLERLKKAGHFLTVVTARPPEVADVTEKWLDDYMPGIFDDIEYCSHGARKDGNHRKKSDVVEDIGADMLIDDNPGHVLGVLEIGRQAILFGRYNWNRNFTAERTGLHRAYNWLEVERAVNRVANEEPGL